MRLRATALQAIRGFFSQRGFTEVETPLRLAAPALEDHIDALPSGDRWLRTSPELHMKRLIAAGAERIFLLGPCFRAEEFGRRHRTEFTMLEWYEVKADYHELRRFTMELLRAVAAAVAGGKSYAGKPLDLDVEAEVITVDDAFQRWGGCSAREALATDEFDLRLVERIEPQLGVGRPTFLVDYPAELAALACRNRDNSALAERWELYIAGLELANAYTELTDPVEQRERFEQSAELRRRQGRDVYPIDEAFMAAMQAGLPPVAGCALGVDRLLMILADRQDIADVLLFDE